MEFNPKESYTFNSLIQGGAFPNVAQTYGSYRHFIMRQGQLQNLLPVQTVVNGRGRSYLYKGSDVIRFVKKIK